MHTLSKSKIMAFRQCPKRLWLEIHRPELRDDSSSETAFEIGYTVGEVARHVYVPNNDAITIDVATMGHENALATSDQLLTNSDEPIFEAGLTIDGALAYADIMLPDRLAGRGAWKMIEIKSSTGIKNYHRDDLAIQTYIATASGKRLTSVALAHIDTSFVYPGNEDYRGLLKEHDLTAETLVRTAEVPQWIADAHQVAAQPEEPNIPTGSHCSDPFPCGFSAYCNREKVWPEYPLSSLPRFSAPKRASMENLKIDDLRKVPDEYLTDLQVRVKAHTQTNSVFFDAVGAASDLSRYGFPARFLDFETIQFAIPIWAGTRPYAQIPFQFSLHQLNENGSLPHHNFLDLSGNDPTRAFAKTLIDVCGHVGPIYVYNAPFENRILRETAERFPEYCPMFEAIQSRIIDLFPIAKHRYYHPSQQGSWSLKALLPAAFPDLSYEKLEGIQDGGAASQAFLEAITPDTIPVRKAEIEKQLIEYCKLDTYALVQLWLLFTGVK